MKLIFAPVNNYYHYTINGETINGIDLSDVREGETWDLPELRAVGIREVYRDGGDLFVVLEQRHGKMPGANQHWGYSDPIEASDYEPQQAYIKPLSMVDKSGWHWERGEDMAWHVVLDPEPEEGKE